MTYDGTELRGTPFEGVWARGVRIVEREEVVEVDNGDDRDYWWNGVVADARGRMV